MPRTARPEPFIRPRRALEMVVADIPHTSNTNKAITLLKKILLNIGWRVYRETTIPTNITTIPTLSRETVPLVRNTITNTVQAIRDHIKVSP